jgi:hypothetical protein
VNKFANLVARNAPIVPEPAHPAGLVSRKTPMTILNVTQSPPKRLTALVVPMEVSVRVLNALLAPLLVVHVRDRHQTTALCAPLGLTSSTVVVSQPTVMASVKGQTE